jgi:hypothetical protein
MTEEAQITRKRRKKAPRRLIGNALHHIVVGVGVGVEARAAVLLEVVAAVPAQYEVERRNEGKITMFE